MPTHGLNVELLNSSKYFSRYMETCKNQISIKKGNQLLTEQFLAYFDMYYAYITLAWFIF